MKTKEYCLILAIAAGILCIPAFGRTELPESHQPFLIGRPNPSLAGIEELYVIIVPPDSKPNKDGLVWEKLEAKAAHKLKESGIKCVTPRSLPIPHLTVHIEMLKLLDSQKYVFHIQTSLKRTVALPAHRNLHLVVDVWKTEPTMQTVSIQRMPAKVTEVVLEQVEAFIHAYLVANPKVVPPADANNVTTTSKEKTRPKPKPAVAKYKYVASKNSKVFHKPDCSSARRIKPKNLVRYNSRAEAIQAGKRPCKRCKP